MEFCSPLVASIRYYILTILFYTWLLWWWWWSGLAWLAICKLFASSVLIIAFHHCSFLTLTLRKTLEKRSQTLQMLFTTKDVRDEHLEGWLQVHWWVGEYSVMVYLVFGRERERERERKTSSLLIYLILFSFSVICWSILKRTHTSIALERGKRCWRIRCVCVCLLLWCLVSLTLARSL